MNNYEFVCIFTPTLLKIIENTRMFIVIFLYVHPNSPNYVNATVQQLYELVTALCVFDDFKLPYDKQSYEFPQGNIGF